MICLKEYNIIISMALSAHMQLSAALVHNLKLPTLLARGLAAYQTVTTIAKTLTAGNITWAAVVITYTSGGSYYLYQRRKLLLKLAAGVITPSTHTQVF